MARLSSLVVASSRVGGLCGIHIRVWSLVWLSSLYAPRGLYERTIRGPLSSRVRALCVRRASLVTKRSEEAGERGELRRYILRAAELSRGCPEGGRE